MLEHTLRYFVLTPAANHGSVVCTMTNTTAQTIVLKEHHDGAGRRWFSASALIGHNMLGEGRWRTVVLHTPNRRVAARELRDRWGVVVPFRRVRWIDETRSKRPAKGDPGAWIIATSLGLYREAR